MAKEKNKKTLEQLKKDATNKLNSTFSTIVGYMADIEARAFTKVKKADKAQAGIWS